MSTQLSDYWKSVAEQNAEIWETHILPSISEVTVNLFPAELQNGDVERAFAIRVSRRSTGTVDSFAVTDSFSGTFNRDLVVTHERLPSGREDEYLREYRFTFLEALTIAERASVAQKLGRFDFEGAIKWAREIQE